MFRTFCHWFRTLEKGASNRHAKKYTHVQKPRKRSLRLESLENRQLLSVNPVTDDVVLSSSIVSEQELQNVIGANFNSAEVEQVSSNDTMDLDLLFQRPITLENSIAISQLMQPYSSGSGLFDNVNIGIAIQERSWGTGSWSTVEDGCLLWAQNEYRLTPSISNMPAGYGVYHTSFNYRTYNAQNQAEAWQYLD